MVGRTPLFTELTPAEKERRIQCTANMRTVCYALSEDLPHPLKGKFDEVRGMAHKQLLTMYRTLGHSLLWIAPHLAVMPNYYIEPVIEICDVEFIGDVDDLAIRMSDDLVPDHIKLNEDMEVKQGRKTVPLPTNTDFWNQKVNVTFGYDLVFAVSVHTEGVRGILKNGLFEGVVRKKSEARKAPDNLAPDADVVEITLGRITRASVDMKMNRGTVWFILSETGEQVKLDFPLDRTQSEREKMIEERLNRMFTDDMTKEE